MKDVEDGASASIYEPDIDRSRLGEAVRACDELGADADECDGDNANGLTDDVEGNARVSVSVRADVNAGAGAGVEAGPSVVDAANIATWP